MADEITTNIYKGDDTGAFGRNYITIKAPVGVDSSLIKKCIFQCGGFQHIQENPEFPYYINPTSDDTVKLDYKNECYLQIFDAEGRKITLKGNLTIVADKQVVNDCSCAKGDHKYAR